MTDIDTWKQIEGMITAIRDQDDVEEVREMIDGLPDNDPDKPDLAEQLAVVESGLNL